MRILLLNQCFHPDVVSTAQHLTDLAVELAGRGHSVTVITSDRGYDDPGVRFPRRESWKGITIYRISSLSLGKERKWRRAVNFASFLTSCSWRLLFLRRFDLVIALTSPPLISFLAALFVQLKGGRFYFWVMDLNPDEAITAGWLKPDSLTARMLGRMLTYSLKKSAEVVVLDRFMRDRILAKGINEDKVTIIPPWSHDDLVCFSERGREDFRARHALEDHFVVMYSGNHSPCHPLDTLLDAARSLREHDEIVFYFVGGGSEQVKVNEFARKLGLSNIRCLPYQPLNELSGSLSAADLHVVVMGEGFAGVVHPCKIYNLMAIGAKTVYIGPELSHVTDIAAQFSDRFLLARHGDSDRVAAGILNLSQRRELKQPRPPAQSSVRFSKGSLLPQLVALIESNQTPVGTLPAAISSVSVICQDTER